MCVEYIMSDRMCVCVCACVPVGKTFMCNRARCVSIHLYAYVSVFNR